MILVDINTVVINTSLSKEEKILDYIRQIKNPYKTRWKDYTVEVAYNENGEDFKSHIKNIVNLIHKKQE